MSFQPIAPNRGDVVQQAADDHPTEWRHAHRSDVTREEAEAFIRIVGSRLHAVDPRFGLNGKRGTTELSQDAVSFKNPAGPGGVEIIDIIGGAGSPQARPVWQNVTQATIDAGTVGRFIAPASDPPVPSGGFQPTAPPQPALVEQAAQDHPAEFQQAGRQGVPGREAEAFVTIVASRLHALDPRFGLNGKRGTTELSQDAVSFQNPAGPGGVEVIRIIADAGSAGARPIWQDVTQATIDAGTVGRFITPPSVSPGPGDGGVEARVAELERRFQELERRLSQLEG